LAHLTLRSCIRAAVNVGRWCRQAGEQVIGMPIPFGITDTDSRRSILLMWTTVTKKYFKMKDGVRTHVRAMWCDRGQDRTRLKRFYRDNEKVPHLERGAVQEENKAAVGKAPVVVGVRSPGPQWHRLKQPPLEFSDSPPVSAS
jgi:hypothetical protein